jgi:Tfp pilus assembly protein PilP
MKKWHAIDGFAGSALMLLLAVGPGALCSRAAEAKAAQPVASAVGTSRPGVTAEAVIPAAKPVYSYRALGKPDPFLPFIETELALKNKLEAELKKKASSKRRPISPLQQAEIEQFRVVGIAGDDVRRAAIVENAASKKFYPLFVGTTIGMNEGRVASIQLDRVIVEEQVEDENKKAKKKQIRRITMVLHKEDDEGKP